MTEQITKLKQTFGKLAGRDREFAESLLRQFANTGRLSDKQWPWVATLVERATNPPAERKRESVGDLSGVLALFDKAANHLKHPAIVLATAAGTIRLYVAGERSKFPGTIQVTEQGGGESRRWYGRISREGIFEQSARLNAECSVITPRLAELAANPAKVAADHGRLTGRCCFCNTALKDERSTAAGYGPTCADHFGLVWGDRPSAFAESVAA